MEQRMKFNKNNPVPPNSIIRLKKLWPHARKNGYEIGQKWKVTYYSKQDGLDCIWMKDAQGNFETGTHAWINKYFEVIRVSSESSYFGKKGC